MERNRGLSPIVLSLVWQRFVTYAGLVTICAAFCRIEVPQIVMFLLAGVRKFFVIH